MAVRSLHVRNELDKFTEKKNPLRVIQCKSIPSDLKSSWATDFLKVGEHSGEGNHSCKSALFFYLSLGIPCGLLWETEYCVSEPLFWHSIVCSHTLVFISQIIKNTFTCQCVKQRKPGLLALWDWTNRHGIHLVASSKEELTVSGKVTSSIQYFMYP